MHPLLRDEVKESRILRFDPASRAIWSLAVVSDNKSLPPGVQALSQVELTNWADQVLKKRMENVRGVGSVTLVGGTKREINLYLNPQAMEALGISAQQVVEAVSNENQDLPVGSIRSLQQDRVVQVQGRMLRPEDFANIIVARKAGSIVRLSQVARVNDGAQELENMALYNGERTLLLSVQKSQDENTIEVVDGLMRTVDAMQTQLPPGVKLQTIYDASRQIRVGVNNVKNLDRRFTADCVDRVFIPQLLALDHHHRPDAADCHHRYVLDHVHIGLYFEYGHVDGFVAVHRFVD